MEMHKSRALGRRGEYFFLRWRLKFVDPVYVLRVTFLVPRIMKWLLDFCKFCAPTLKGMD